MDLGTIAKSVQNKTEFISFLQEFQRRLKESPDEFENLTVEHYLEAMEGYLEGSTERSLHKVDFTPSWRLFAQIMLTASIYE